MLSHYLKPLWKRKSRHILLSLEIALAFLLVFAVVAAAGRYHQLSSLPTGFSHASVWSIDVEVPDHSGMASDPQSFMNLKRSLESLPQVEGVSLASFSPYRMSTWNSDFYHADGETSTLSEMMEVGDEFAHVVGMSLDEGRWFSSVDDGAAEVPVVINRAMALAMFPGNSALGQVFSDDKPGAENSRRLKVVGVVDAFRSRGEYMSPGLFVLTRLAPDSDGSLGPSTLLVKLKPGIGREFEMTINERLRQVNSDWGYTISPLSELRRSLLATQEAPLKVLAVIAAFLLLMVAFGLFGVLWQSTTQRIPEIGLRRAVGAHSGNIYWQIVIEQWLLSSLAMAAGLILLLQLPISGALGENLDWPLFLGATAVSMLAIYALSTLCALYPAWRASRLSPTEALHYE